jgi:hypothetical protein
MTNRHEFTAEETTRLLDELDARLRRRGAAASIFVVGGAAIAANHTRRGRVTQDIDALTRDTEVLEEAKALARERGLPENWLNPNAGMWMPPLPGGVLDHPGEPGLRVTYADDGFLLATKLVALATYRPGSRPHTIATARLARAHAQAGDPDQACTLALQAVDTGQAPAVAP